MRRPSFASCSPMPSPRPPKPPSSCWLSSFMLRASVWSARVAGEVLSMRESGDAYLAIDHIVWPQTGSTRFTPDGVMERRTTGDKEMTQPSPRFAFTRRAVCTLALACLPLAAAHAQAPFPEQGKPIRLVVTYPAGGSSDLMARIMGQKLSEYWKTPVVIESKPGAAGAIGMEFTARQAADGYTFVVANLGPAAVNPLITKVPYNMEKDFIPVALTATGPNILVVPANSPYKTLGDMLSAAKAKPGALSFGTSGAGSMAHLGGELIMRQAGIKMAAVP
ncbi:MAG: tripartite tricarboxylate transporter substrate binding protein, partial [Comamonadaceae bacterium]